MIYIEIFCKSRYFYLIHQQILKIKCFFCVKKY